MPTTTERAQILFSQHREQDKFSPFTNELAINAVNEAYAVQHALVELELTALDSSIVGYIIGLTAPRMQALLGIDSPIAGVVYEGRLHDSGTTVRRQQFVNLGIECEIGIRIGRDLAPNDGPFDFYNVSRAVDAVCPAFELVDDRSADYAETDIESLIADNSWNAGVVLGPWQKNWPDLAILTGRVSRNGEFFDSGKGSDVLGHPFEALTWLANHLSTGQRGLRAGDIVASGSMIPTRVPLTPEVCSFEVDDLGVVTVTIED